jgi:hypothetical protein
MAMKVLSTKTKKVAKKSMKKKGGKKKKATKRISKIARGKHRRSQVFTGKKEKTVSGLTKDDYKKNADGNIVSKKRSDTSKKNFQKGLAKWFKAVSAARKKMGIKGMVPVGGKTERGQALLKKTRSLYKKLK